MSIDKINIPEKADSPNKKALLARLGVPQDESLSAQETNKLVGKTNELVEKTNELNQKVNEFNPIESPNYKETVATYADLLLLTGVQKDDMYQVEADGRSYIYNGTSFQPNGKGFQFGIKPPNDSKVEVGNMMAVSGGEVYEKSALKDDFKKIEGKNKFNYLRVVEGYISPTNEDRVQDVSYKRSLPIKVNEKRLISISGLGNIHHGLGWRVNRPDGSVALRGASAINVTSFTIILNNISCDIDSIEFTCKTNRAGDNIDIEAIQVEYGSITPFEPYQLDLSVSKVITEDSEDESPINIKYLRDNVIQKSELELVVGKNIYDYNKVINDAYINLTDGTLVTEAIAVGYKCSSKIKIKPEIISISGLGNSHWGLGWAITNNDNVVLKRGVSGSDVTSFSISAIELSDEIYLQFTCKTMKTGDNTNIQNIQVEYGGVTDFEPYTSTIDKISGYGFNIKNNNQSNLADKKVLFLGDSITTEDYGVTNWPSYFRALLSVTDFKNYARSGASFTNWTGYDNIRQQLSAQIEQAITDNYVPDVIIIAIGTNDYQRQSSFGNYDEVIVKNIADLDKTKVLEAARWAFWKCKEQWGNSICFYANPLQRVNTVNSSELDDNGNWLRNPIERMARRYNFIVIDQYSQSGIVKDFEVPSANGRFLIDGLHPNTDGKQRQGAFLANFVSKNYFKIFTTP